MSNQWFDLTASAGCMRQTPAPPSSCAGALLANSASASPGENLSAVRGPRRRLGPIIGSALACPYIARPRGGAIMDKFQFVISEDVINPSMLIGTDLAPISSTATSPRWSQRRGDGKDGLPGSRTVRSPTRTILGTSPAAPPGPSLADAIAPAAANASTTPTQMLPAEQNAWHADREIRFGIVIPVFRRRQGKRQ